MLLRTTRPIIIQARWASQRRNFRRIKKEASSPARPPDPQNFIVKHSSTPARYDGHVLTSCRPDMALLRRQKIFTHNKTTLFATVYFSSYPPPSSLQSPGAVRVTCARQTLATGELIRKSLQIWRQHSLGIQWCNPCNNIRNKQTLG